MRQIRDVMALVASIERKLIAKRLYGGRRERSKRDGRGSGRLPFGYLRLEDGTISADEKAAGIIRRLLALCDSGLTYQATANQLNTEGFTTPRNGRAWTVGHVKSIERKRELYATGLRSWGGVEAGERWPALLALLNEASGLYFTISQKCEIRRSPSRVS